MNELAKLTYGDAVLDADAPSVVLRGAKEKTGKTKRFYLPDGLTEALKARTAHPAAILFPRADGQPWTTQTMTKSRLRKAVEGAAKAGEVRTLLDTGNKHVKRFDFHSLRHTARSLYRELGHDGYAIGELLGQSNAQTAATYTHVADAELRAMPNALLDKVTQSQDEDQPLLAMTD